MKILFNCPVPFSLAHGGAQIQIEQTQAALEKIGVQVEPLRWWDENQSGDILHHFGRIPTWLLHLAQQKGMKVVLADLLTAQGSRSPAKLKLQRLVFRMLKATIPASAVQRFDWESYQLADACVALTPWEASLMTLLFNAPPGKVHVVANGVEDVFFQSEKTPRGKWLVCTATITERKRVLELAEAAVVAKTPVWIIGKSYTETDPYAQRFLAMVKKNPELIRYEGPISDRAQLARIYREARGFVLLSTMESLSLSALEAAACECPLLLSDLPWARTTFSENAMYCPITSSSGTALCLREFYDEAPNLKSPPKPLTWIAIAEQLKVIYQRILERR
jgi:glycosyltransferase involved in cell wall biosynthesis